MVYEMYYLFKIIFKANNGNIKKISICSKIIIGSFEQILHTVFPLLNLNK